jgi:endonuclease/exonuclease/phosphatase family metal-dependent hydrolase
LAANVLLNAVVGFCQDDEPAKDQLKVMSFNIRNGMAKDGENRWDKRKSNVVTTIVESESAVIGLQECHAFQAAFLRENLNEYEYFGRSREDRDAGEQCGIFFKGDRFDLLESGHFWLSETPNEPGSKSWDSSLPRMASWVKLFDRSSKQTFYFLNTHFDHRGQVAREKSAELIVDRVGKFEAGLPVIVAGDFNTAPESPPHRVLAGALTDSFGSLHPDAEESGTFGGFQGKKSGPRIDFVFTSGAEVLSAAINHRNFDGRDPSDHFPITSTIRLVETEKK